MTIGEDLHTTRLRARERRIIDVLGTLEERNTLYAAQGAPRAPLQAAIRDFARELDRVRADLRALADDALCAR